jgi:hypothetical protein
VSTVAALRAPSMFARKSHLFGARCWWRSGRRYEDLWPFADAWSALCTLGSLPGQHEALGLLAEMPKGLRHYGTEADMDEGEDDLGFESVVTPPLGGGGDRFYDDNAWLGLALVRHHQMTADPSLLRLARRVFGFVVSGWSTDPAWAMPGGIRWKEPVTTGSRNTCANGPAAALAVRLYETTRDEDFLEWASRIYGWTRRALLTPGGLYADRITPDGALTPTFWSYNQGTMIGSGVLVARSSGDTQLLEQAVETADASLGTDGGLELMEQDPAFNAVFFRNLLMLDEERPDPRYRTLMTDYADAMWTRQRRPHGLFGGKGSPLNNTAAMVQIFALLAGARPHP